MKKILFGTLCLAAFAATTLSSCNLSNDDAAKLTAAVATCVPALTSQAAPCVTACTGSTAKVCAQKCVSDLIASGSVTTCTTAFSGLAPTTWQPLIQGAVVGILDLYQTLDAQKELKRPACTCPVSAVPMDAAQPESKVAAPNAAATPVARK